MTKTTDNDKTLLKTTKAFIKTVIILNIFACIAVGYAAFVDGSYITALVSVVVIALLTFGIYKRSRVSSLLLSLRYLIAMVAAISEITTTPLDVITIVAAVIMLGFLCITILSSIWILRYHGRNKIARWEIILAIVGGIVTLIALIGLILGQ